MSIAPRPRNPLVAFGGERPPAPDWFDAALARAPQRSTFDHDGAAIELLTWGEIGKPGLLFLHGNAAHADWWSFIAPFFANDYRCAALSWSGMGRSGWRERYSTAQFAAEALHAIGVAGLDAAGPPVVIGHSFGSFPLLHIAAHHGERIAAGILIDALSPRSSRRPASLDEERSLRRYPSEADALARFRFMPAQDSGIPAVIDFLARESLQEVEPDGEVPGGWTWRFDPRIWSKYDRGSNDPDLMSRVHVPLGLIYGEDSAIVKVERVQEAMAEIRMPLFVTAIPCAGHHIMADQPLALVSALRTAVSLLDLRHGVAHQPVETLAQGSAQGS